MNEESIFKKIRVMASVQRPSSQQWPMHQVSGLKLQIGYPDSKGIIQWKSATRFQDKNKELSGTPVLAAWTEITVERVYVFDFTYHQLESHQQKIHAKITLPYTSAKQGFNEEETLVQAFDVLNQPNGAGNIGPLHLEWMIVPMQ